MNKIKIEEIKNKVEEVIHNTAADRCNGDLAKMINLKEKYNQELLAQLDYFYDSIRETQSNDEDDATVAS